MLRRIILIVLPVLILGLFFFLDSLSENSRNWGVLFLFLIMTSLLINMPLGVAKQDKHDMFLATLPLSLGDIVKARYLSFICIQVVFALPPLFIKFLLFPNNEMIYFYIVSVFLAASLLAALIYPIFFLFQSRSATSMFQSLLFAVLVSVYSFTNSREIAYDLPITVAAAPVKAIAAGFIFLCLSCLLSHKIYKTRDLSRKVVTDDAHKTMLRLN